MLISDNLTKIKKNIDIICHNHAIRSDNILLLAVSKGQSAEKIKCAYELNIIDFGENFYQELRQKQQQLRHLPINWHYLGNIQSNKIKYLANACDWVHSICSIKQACHFSEKRDSTDMPLNICLQVNLDNEITKSGFSIQALYDAIMPIQALPHLKLRGLMCIPKKRKAIDEQIKNFQRMNDMLRQINQRYQTQLDTLSMGMSDDYEAAIIAGSTIVRIGRALFGERI